MLFKLVPGGFSYLKNQNNQNSKWKKLLGLRNMQEMLEKDRRPISKSYYCGIIPMLRRQKEWVGGVRKWPFLLMFSNVFMLT